tara:strand:- start:12027 stop:12638 length:612 start_codon:yes stop_codon:yes gene_type:complete
MGLFKLMRKLPIDLGQEGMRLKTKGKLIAYKAVPEPKPGQTALDVGCREGTQSRRLEKKGYKVTSIDIEKAYEKCRVVDCNKKLPFKTNSFDFVWCSEVIEHLDNPEASAKEMMRVLKPEGLLVLTTPNSKCWVYRALSLIGLSPQKIQNPDHKHFFGEKNMRNIFQNAAMLGYFPYMMYKKTIRKNLNFLTPAFVIIWKKGA